MTRPPPPDQAQRDAAVAERERNVLVDAGAGTGKTTLLVRRLVQMIAPEDGGPHRPLSRIAAVTFTRKAAGELRLRIRERILGELARPGLSALRRERLADALATIDTAYVGTIHAFADRLLRLRPVEARLSPTYAVVDEPDLLLHETFELLLGAAQAGTLAQELAGRVPEDRCEEAQGAILDALRAGVRAESREQEWNVLRGLDALFAGFVNGRDVPPDEPAVAPFELAAFRTHAAEFRERAAGLGGPAAGTRWLLRSAARLADLEDEEDPVALLKELNGILRTIPKKTRKGQEFGGDPDAWEAWLAWKGERVRATPLRDDLCAPLHRWMTLRLVRAFPVVIAAYEKVKARHDTVDQVDLLLKLRDILRDDLEVRAQFQALFDHVFVDEFQDTDPLQAEIVLYLCEARPKAARWTDVVLRPGKLTVVGDPKQSIYRFRRADIAMYERVRELVQRGPHLAVALTASFRSEPALIEWFNDRFDEVLGAAAGGAPAFDAATGTVANQHLERFRDTRVTAPVKLLAYGADDTTAAALRAVEASAIATWLRSVVDGGALTITDPLDGRPRPARYGDVAVLAASTFNLRLLLDACDRLGVPSAARGGVLFLSDPLHRQLLLALRAVADRDDGVALAALLRPPFFAVDVGDLARARVPGADDDGVRRARAAEAWVRELRRRRLSRPPGQTARDLLDGTGFARHVALGPNGTQRLARLRELCLELERLAAAEGLDYDAATGALRPWAVDPVAFDPPRPVGAEAVQVLSIHQAKGLEFPVVVLWDGCAEWIDRNNGAPAWCIAADASRWAVKLDGLEWEEPAGAGIAALEKRYREAERKRLVYVAATRARDVLVVPVARPASPKRINGLLAAGGPEGAVESLAAFGPDEVPEYAEGIEPPAPGAPEVATALAAAVERRWAEAAGEAGRPRFAPAAVSSEAHVLGAPSPAPADGEGGSDDEAGSRRKFRPGRFGREFGDVVHHAIGIALAAPGAPVAEAVARAARELAVAVDLRAAADDVERALSALEAAGLRRAPGPELQLEYPVAIAREGKLLVGYVDLLAAADGRLDVIDFKTDRPPEGDVTATHPDYVAQVRTYGQLLAELGLAAGRTVRCGLLFTADGGIRWV
ncbi:UvrD-helicase domain-containing protein [Anaeromyxobacter sp. Red801]|uniref:UvrD-helicase domain-containing protein n=1 Tax=Anaeromyxobacter sp. Red801 TaxID=3411632 RepID=UPI003B9FE01E